MPCLVPGAAEVYTLEPRTCSATGRGVVRSVPVRRCNTLARRALPSQPGDEERRHQSDRQPVVPAKSTHGSVLRLLASRCPSRLSSPLPLSLPVRSPGPGSAGALTTGATRATVVGTVVGITTAVVVGPRRDGSVGLSSLLVRAARAISPSTSTATRTAMTQRCCGPWTERGLGSLGGVLDGNCRASTAAEWAMGQDHRQRFRSYQQPCRLPASTPFAGER